MRIAYRRLSWAFGAIVSTFSIAASAQTATPSDAPADPTGAPPADAKAIVAAPSGPAEAPPDDPSKVNDSTTATVSAGGQLATGNSQLLAGSGTGTFEMRRGANGFGAGVIGNYGQGGSPIKLSTENLQGRLRYDRYLLPPLSVFLIGTGRYDRFQGLDFRLNIDPGVKYLFITNKDTTLWGEAGYDFQYDIRRDADRVIVDDNGNPVLDANGQVQLVDKTHADHSARLFAGFKHAFNKEVTLATGLEYLQSFVDSTNYRLNYDALLAANLGAGFSFGLGFSARYDHAPLSGKKDLDTVTTFNLIYAFSDAPDKSATCPCPDPNAPPPPCANPPPPPPPPQPLPNVVPPTPIDTTPPPPPVQTMMPPPPTDGSQPPPQPLPNQ
jgi:putative salt-induced outer membrane protein YdiY